MFTELSSLAAQILSDKFPALDKVQVEWRRPQEAEHGDISTVIALQLAKQLGVSPQEIAQVLCTGLTEAQGVEKCEVAGPGYVNIWLKPSLLIEALSETRAACTAKVKRDEAPVIIEYSQPNIAKPLGVHHLLTTLIGQAVSNLYAHAGYNVIRWNYLGDWGTQFGKLSVALQKWGSKPAAECTLDDLLTLYVKFHEEAEANPELEDEGREAFRKLEAGDPELAQVREDIVTVTKEALGSIYDRLHVSFDLDLGEAFYQDKMTPILEEGEQKGVFTEGEGGALIVEFAEETKLPPYMVRKGDGATLYSTRDIAQMRYRMDTYDPAEILIVTDIAQQLHFQQLEQTCELLGWDLPEFCNVLVGRMSFADRKMSTRKGNVLKLSEVLDEAHDRATTVIADHGDTIQTDDADALAEMMGVGAVAYGVLSQNRKQNLVFDWDRMLSFDGNSAPYVQYTHARAQSVLRKSETEQTDFPGDVTTLEAKERALIGTLLQLPSVLEEARAERMPHILTTYLFQLCQEYNAFYNDLPILKADDATRTLRLALTHLTASVLRAGADILTIRVPDRM